jgi:hypothetical protein
MADQWKVEPSGPGMLGRLLVPQTGTKPAMTAFLVGLAGTAAFVASLVMKWQRISVALDSSNTPGRSSSDPIVITAGLGSIDVLGLVYLLGALALIAMLGSVLVRPDQALRLRMGAAGLGIGILAVLVAISMRLPETIFNLQGIFGGLSGDEQQAMLDRSDVAYESGLFAGFAAIALLTAGVWLAGAPAARAFALYAAQSAAYPGHPQPGFAYPTQLGPQPMPNGSPPDGTVPSAEPPAPVIGPAAVPTWPVSRVGHVDGLSVSASEPLDPGTATEVWRG